MKAGMFADIPVDVGVVYEGERIRKEEMYAELGGPKVEHKFELLRVKPLEEVEDGKIEVIGPEFKDMKEGTITPFGIYIEIAGKELEEEMEGVFERRIHYFMNWIEGFMHLNQRNIIWLRVGKKAVRKGLTLEMIGKVLTRLYKSECPIIEKIQITFITDPAEVKKRFEDAIKVYEARDARARGLKDGDVEVFYGCTLCQSFAPTHVCVITPERYANCGAISWFDGRAAAKVDPKGPIFEIKKGNTIDEFAGEWEGVNEIVKEKSLGEVTRVQLYTAFGYPHTSCGCFEAIAFYMPEVDGLGIVHRDFKGAAINGIPFSTMADSTAGGRQVDGFHGISFEYMRSPKFLQVDGGWNRIVWMPSEVKERVKDFVPKEILDKIPTEKDVKNIDEMKSFLESHGHPIVERMKAAEVAAPPAPAEVEAAAPPLPAPALPALPISTAAGGLTVTLKNAKIYAEKLILRRKKEGKR
jgi:acetyl-CoA decarbonylase/synthase complex subunit beta